MAYTYPSCCNLKELFRFPPKAALKLRTKVVEKRKVGLQDFLNRACRWINFLRDESVLEFIEVQNRQYLEELEEKDEDDVYEESKAGAPQMEFSTEEERKIAVILEGLERNDKGRYRLVEELSTFLKSRLSFAFCLKILIGDEEMRIRGLLQYIAQVESNYLVSFACLSLLSKLMDYSRCKRAQTFRDLFCKIDVQFIREIGLDKHILAGAESDNIGIKVVDAYLKGTKST